MPSLRDEIGDFVGIPISFVEDTEQTAESRVVFMILRYHTNRKRKRAFPGYETIMRETGLSRQKTAAGIKVLTTTGWLVKHKQFAKVTEYELCYPAPAYSSTGELRQEPSLVPPANAVSSTTEQPPFSDNKIEFNKIRERGGFQHQEKPRPPDNPYADPNRDARAELMGFLHDKTGPIPAPGANAKAINWLLESGYSSDECKRCWEWQFSQRWRDTPVNWMTVKRDIGSWKAKGESLQNGNGATSGKQQSQFETASERNVRNIRESLARFAPDSGDDNHQDPALLLTASVKPR